MKIRNVRLDNIWLNLIILLLSPAAAFLCVEWFTHNPLTILTLKVALWNILFYEMVYWFLFFLSGRVRIALFAGNLLFLLFGLTNYFVVSFRSNPIVPWDIYSLRTAANVAENYDYSLTAAARVCLLVFLALFVLAFFCRYRIRKMKWIHRLASMLAICLLFGGYLRLLFTPSFIKSMKLDMTLFTPYYMSRKDGLTTAFLIDLQFIRVSVPDGYSAEETEEELEAYPEDTGSVSGQTLPNIIVIMDEAFSDPAVLGDFKTNEDYMPFVHKLQDGAADTVSGYLNVSVKGGNTANTEYEFLTGNTMRFLPGGCVPYQQYMFGDKASIVSWLEQLGYKTAAMHPFNANGWNRNKVYEYFGFDDLLFNNRFPNAARTRKYINDEACFDKIIELHEQNDSGHPLFIFAVTMQNHSGYFESFDNFEENIVVEDNKYQPLNRFLSLMQLSDHALEDLVDYFSKDEEPTIIVFFGDHQPNDVIVEPILKMNGKTGKDLTPEENALRYLVPYIIWANYDIPEEQNTETSVNYLLTHVLQTAGLPLSSFQQYLTEEIESEIPVITTQKLAASDGHTMTEEEEEASETLHNYRKLQYYRMYDEPRDDES